MARFQSPAMRVVTSILLCRAQWKNGCLRSAADSKAAQAPGIAPSFQGYNGARGWSACYPETPFLLPILKPREDTAKDTVQGANRLHCLYCDPQCVARTLASKAHLVLASWCSTLECRPAAAAEAAPCCAGPHSPARSNGRRMMQRVAGCGRSIASWKRPSNVRCGRDALAPALPVCQTWALKLVRKTQAKPRTSPT